MQDGEFKRLIQESRAVEYAICRWYQQNVDRKSRLALHKCKEYDIICPTVQNVEVKLDRLASHSDNYAFEFEDATGEKSGIALTTAGEFVVVDYEHVIRLKTTALLFFLRECKQKRIVQMGYTTKEGKRAWGYLVPREKLLYSPYAQAMKRWF